MAGWLIDVLSSALGGSTRAGPGEQRHRLVDNIEQMTRCIEAGGFRTAGNEPPT
ncbi:hypothetical protein ACFPM0_01860 [Pseudonocardia sulfidoxydans]|uniref:hypothetical protein n=1 Tax=Pseudonocardia sulfidoxydans TaxID=54011 RepID=UPI0036091B5D